MNETYAYISILDPQGGTDSLAARIGISPTKIGRKGDLIGKTKLVAKHDSWIVEGPLSRANFDVARHVRELLILLEPKKNEIREVVDECEGTFTVVAYFHHANENFSLTKDKVSLISQMGLGIWCDFYSLPEEEPTP